METIELINTLPVVFNGRDQIDSDLWHREVSFCKGNYYLIEAASGTGKTSLCSYLYGYRDDYEGIIRFDDVNIRNFVPDKWVALRRQSLTMLFQELRLFPELTAKENVWVKNRLTGYKSRKEIKILFERLGIADKENTRINRLSFGQQQRVAFIRALCQPFDFILLDEPISHIDDTNAAVMSELLVEEVGHQGAGVIVTSIGKHLPLAYSTVYRL